MQKVDVQIISLPPSILRTEAVQQCLFFEKNQKVSKVAKILWFFQPLILDSWVPLYIQDFWSCLGFLNWNPLNRWKSAANLIWHYLPYTVLEIWVNPWKKCSRGFDATNIWVWAFPNDPQNIFQNIIEVWDAKTFCSNLLTDLLAQWIARWTQKSKVGIWIQNNQNI